jgi:hypothetical protein
MWETVSEKYNNRKDERAPWRDIDSIRNKFKNLKNATKPTGDPTCPPNVIRAKRLAKEIEDGECVFQLDSSENSDGDDSMSNHISSSDCSDSPVLARHALNSSPPAVIIDETAAVNTFIVPESFMHIEDSQQCENIQSDQDEGDAFYNYEEKSVVKRPSNSKSNQKSSSQVAPRLGTDAVGLQGVMEMLKKGKEMDKKGKKRDAIPDNPTKAKRTTFAKSIQDIDEQFSRSQDAYQQQFLMHQQLLAAQQREERMWREDERRRQDERREDEKRRQDEERRRSEQKFELECQRHSTLMTALIFALNPTHAHSQGATAAPQFIPQ